jgi:antitoxin component YwqK of YwqJK toxin-antitoxin module
MKIIYVAVFSGVVLCSCDTKKETSDCANIKDLTTSSGAYNLAAMVRSGDSAKAATFIPDTFFKENKKYNGKVEAFNPNKKKIASGTLKDGLMDGDWKYFYASGVVNMEGKYKNGKEQGLWMAYYRQDVPKVAKYYAENGALLMRADYNDNGKVTTFYNVKDPIFLNKERAIETGGNETLSFFVQNNELYLKGDKTLEKIGKNVFDGIVKIKSEK